MAGYTIAKGVDGTKDQSYVLWGLQQDLLARTLLPLGPYRKTEIRQMALDYGYPELAKKSESYEICFVPDNDYRGFLKRRVEGLEQRVQGGNFVRQGREYPGYSTRVIRSIRSVSGRAGMTFGKPVYVTAIRPETNTVVLGDETDLDAFRDAGGEDQLDEIRWGHARDGGGDKDPV